MNALLTLVVCMAVLTWLCLLAASLARVGGVTPRSLMLAFGNRDDLPPASPLAGRAERTARNTLEAFVLFAAITLVAQAAAVQSPRLLLGAQVFFWSRLAYIPVYWAGIKVLRTAVWTVGMVGLAMMISTLV